MVFPDLTEKEAKALVFIRNTWAHRGKSPSIREIQETLGYKSPRSAALIVDALIGKQIVERRGDGALRILNDLEENAAHARTVAIPLVGSAACGTPLLAEENIEAMIPVSTSLAKPGHRYFLLRARGDSMDLANIEDGDLVLVRQQSAADNGDIVVALIDDSATIKEFRRTSTAVVLAPKSRSVVHQPIILLREFQIQGKVIATIGGIESRPMTSEPPSHR
jgi:repressor LexA